MQPAERPPHPNPLPRSRGRGGKSKSNSHGGGESNSNNNSNDNNSNDNDNDNDNDSEPATRVAGANAQPTADAWRPGATLEVIRLRAQLNAHVRAFFAQRQVLEVETPVLSQAGNTEPNIDSFTTAFSGHVSAGARTRWLRTSPEYPLKRLLAAGVGDCYELGRVFRNGEAGGRHNPEFTMLEWYRVGWDHVRLAEETVALVQGALALVGRSATVRSLSYRALFQRALQIDPFSAPLEQLQAALGPVRVDPQGLERDDWLDLLVSHRLQPDFAGDAITIVHDWPASQAALARIRPGDPPVAERFELYLGAVELANGYHELRDADEQRARFSHDNQRRAARGLVQPPPDWHLLDALPLMPHCAGVAVGMDRLLMAMLGTSRIAEVLAFDFARA
ncbi:EF-P lysine aminoacylase GenX [Pseudoxanthomonas spadix]|nr:EF-P lysine aminoacylase GenX [Pseudoxanthomonas spadix]